MPPIGRLLAAALLTMLWITAAYGAGSSAVPPGALASAHASIGAALVHQGAATGRGDEESGAGWAAAQRAAEELLPPGDEGLPAAARPAEVGPGAPAGPADPVTTPDDAERSRTVPATPPARHRTDPSPDPPAPAPTTGPARFGKAARQAAFRRLIPA